jgi:transposase
MFVVRQIIQLFNRQYSIREISRRLSLSRNTVRSYLRQLKTSTLDWHQLNELADIQLQELLTPQEDKQGNERYQTLLSLLPELEKELTNPKVNKYRLWLEYRQQEPEGYQYRQFCYHFETWQQKQKVSLHQEYKAGDKLFIDFAGDKLHYVDPNTGEIVPVEVFVGILGASQLTYVQATRSQNKKEFLDCLRRNLEFIGGVPECIVPDNLKSAVTTPDRYEPTLNPTIGDFALHYHTSIVPARVRKPKDKALVEGAVNIIYSRIYAPLRNRTFYSIEELNQAMLELCEQHNQTKFQGKEYSRRDLFEEKEKLILKPLPQEKYQVKHYQEGRVQQNSHVQLKEDAHHYSVPYRYVGQRVKLIYTLSTVEIYHKLERIAVHGRKENKYGYTTLKEHLPPTHQWMLNRSPEYFIQQAEQIGPFTTAALEVV